jgi:hypothetical protein
VHDGDRGRRQLGIGIELFDRCIVPGLDVAEDGSDALQRVVSEAEHRPLITVGVALGIGILVGAAILGSAGSRR